MARRNDELPAEEPDQVGEGWTEGFIIEEQLAEALLEVERLKSVNASLLEANRELRDVALGRTEYSR